MAIIRVLKLYTWNAEIDKCYDCKQVCEKYLNLCVYWFSSIIILSF